MGEIHELKENNICKKLLIKSESFQKYIRIRSYRV